MMTPDAPLSTERIAELAASPFTPGPWRVWQEGGDGGPWFVTMSDGADIQIGFLADGTPDEGNARLIAAVPDLLSTAADHARLAARVVELEENVFECLEAAGRPRKQMADFCTAESLIGDAFLEMEMRAQAAGSALAAAEGRVARLCNPTDVMLMPLMDVQAMGGIETARATWKLVIDAALADTGPGGALARAVEALRPDKWRHLAVPYELVRVLAALERAWCAGAATEESNG